jgi:hypothetical protein
VICSPGQVKRSSTGGGTGDGISKGREVGNIGEKKPQYAFERDGAMKGAIMMRQKAC